MLTALDHTRVYIGTSERTAKVAWSGIVRDASAMLMTESRCVPNHSTEPVALHRQNSSQRAESSSVLEASFRVGSSERD